jgi:hypothetical protein
MFGAIINRIPVISYFTRLARIFYQKKTCGKKISKKQKEMEIFSILKIDDEYSAKNYPLDKLRLDPRAVSPNQSGVTTAPMDVVTLNHTSTKYSKCLTGLRL